MKKTMKMKEYRKAAGLSQAALSRELGIPKRTIENWEMESRTPPEYVEYLICFYLAQKFNLEEPEKN